jgi:hypothetical protein
MDDTTRPELREAPAVVEGPSSEERLLPDERIARALARQQAGSAFAAKSVADYRRRAKQAEEAYGVRPDEEVSTDAVMAALQEGGDWRARWVLAEQNGGLVVRGLSLEPTTQSTPPSGITSSLLRSLSPSRIAAEAAHAALEDFPGQDVWWASLRVKWAKEEVVEHRLQDQPGPRPGRPKLSDDLLRDVAIAYLEEMRAGRGVLRRLGERFERPETTIRDWVRIARREGWLGPAAKSGRRGADPGPRLLAERPSQDEGSHE